MQQTTCPVNSYNEWDPLEEVVVGTPFGMGSMSLEKDPVILNLIGRNFVHLDNKILGAGKPFDKESIEKGVRELDNFVRILQNEGVKVRRPDEVRHDQPFKTPDWEVPVGNAATCPRDTLIVFGNEIIEAPMSMRARYFEFRAFRSLITEYWRGGALWTSAPKPIMADNLYVKDYAPYVKEVIQDRWDQVEKGNLGLTEVEPVWDAADFLRLGKDVIGQHSLATNLSGIEWVRRHLAPKGFRVHTMQFKNCHPRHIDDTFMALRPGIALNCDELPPYYGKEMFDKSGWKIYTLPISKHNYGSININFLSIDEKTIFVEEKEQEVVKFAESLGCRVLQIPFSSCYYLGGSTHCCTLDVRRRGGMQSYFPHLDELEKQKEQAKEHSVVGKRD